MPENDVVVYEAWRNNSGSYYEAGEFVRHKGHKFMCRLDHWSEDDSEPSVGRVWTVYWVLIEEVEFPIVDMSTQLVFAPKPVMAGGELEEVDIDRLAELVESGECKLKFELRYPECKPIRIADMELIDIEETELGTVAHFLVLRDLTDEEE